MKEVKQKNLYPIRIDEIGVNKEMVQLYSGGEHFFIEKENLPALIAALSELTGGQTWEDWMRRAEYAAAEYTKPIPIRGAKMQACTYKYMLDWIRDNVPLLPNTVGDIKVKRYWVLAGFGKINTPTSKDIKISFDDIKTAYSVFKDYIKTYDWVNVFDSEEIQTIYKYPETQPLPPAPNQNNEG